MKILCTSDWHLGKRTENKSRLDDQRNALDSIVEIAKKHAVDAVIVAGDVFDTSVPPSEAENLFYEYAELIGKSCLFVAISGNHDDASRLCASLPIAQNHNVILYGGKGVDFKKGNLVCDDRGFTLTKDGQTLSVAILPYPSESAIMLGDGESYSEIVGEKIKEKCSIFTPDGFNVFVSHLFMSGSLDNLSDERELGTAKLLPVEVLPDCDFNLLGHVHKPMLVSKQKEAHYCGSLLPYSFDDSSEKRVMIVEKTDGKVSVTSEKITGYRKLARVQASSIEEIFSILQSTDDLLEITFTGTSITPLDYTRMKRYENFVSLKMVSVAQTKTAHRKSATTGELFTMFYKQKRGKEPEQELIDVFVEYVEKAEA